MTLRLAEIVQSLAGQVQAELVGNPELQIERLSTLEASGPNDLTFLSNPKYSHQLARSAAGCVVVAPSSREVALQRTSCIVVDDPYHYFALITQLWKRTHFPAPAPRIHPSAVIDPQAILAPHVSIGAFVCIAAGAVVGEGARHALRRAQVEEPERRAQRLRRRTASGGAPGLRERADLLLHREEPGASLLDEGVSEDVPEVRDVAPERIEGVGHGA